MSKTAFDKIEEGLPEALAIVRGEGAPYARWIAAHRVRNRIVLALRKEGLTFREIAQRVGVSRARVGQIISKAAYRERLAADP